MKKKVKLSLFSKLLTFVAIGLLLAIIVMEWENPSKQILAAAILLLMIGLGVVYSPTSIETTEENLVINHLIGKKRIPFSSIKSVERCYPSPGGLRLCGSGGFMGYWGYFSDIVFGNYFGYYGDPIQCMLLKLSNEKQYVISCVDPEEMLSEIESHIQG